jgi:signal transduction histidine kinase
MSDRFRLCDFIELRQADILREWEHAVRRDPRMNALPLEDIRDLMPRLLRQLAEMVRHTRAGERGSLHNLPELHALHRLDVGLDLEVVIAELSELRRTVLEAWEPHALQDSMELLRELRMFDEAMDVAIRQSADHYAMYRERTLQVLECISSAALGRQDMGQFLRDLLAVLLSNIEGASSCAIYLPQPDLYVHAPLAVTEQQSGLTEDLARTLSSTLASRAPTGELLSVAQVQRTHRAGGAERSRYCAPLVIDGALVAIVLLAAKAEDPFGERDRQLMRVMLQRAAEVIARDQLVEKQRQDDRRRVEFERELVGIVSHDLRNPLSVVTMGASSLLMRADELDDQTVRTVARIRNAAEAAARLIEDLLDFTRARLGTGIPVQRTMGNVHDVVVRAANDVLAAFPDRTLGIRTAGPPSACFDEQRLAQVISNLVTNAIKYSAPDSPITLTCTVTSETIGIDVHNEGAPIPEDLLPRLFEPLRKKHGGRAGLGLGLFIVSEIVQAHGGTVTVDSRAGAGTTFAIRLPARGC